MNYSPCDSCPFRTDIPAYLTRGRAQEIRDVLLNNGSFHCHTLDYSAEPRLDDDGFYLRVTKKSRFCAGALGLMKRDGVLFDNALVRLLARFREFDPDALKLDDLPGSFDDWVKRQQQR